MVKEKNGRIEYIIIQSVKGCSKFFVQKKTFMMDSVVSQLYNSKWNSKGITIRNPTKSKNT